MTTAYLRQDVARDEGLRLVAYPDPLTHAEPWTIGYGHTGPDVHPGLVWTQAQADDALAEDLGAVQRELDKALPWWRQLNDARQDVLVNMGFNMGVPGLLKFKRTIAAIYLKDYAGAAADMLASAWAQQVHARAQRLALQMNSGVRAA